MRNISNIKPDFIIRNDKPIAAIINIEDYYSLISFVKESISKTRELEVINDEIAYKRLEKFKKGEYSLISFEDLKLEINEKYEF